MCSRGRERECKHSRIRGCISGYCEPLSLWWAYPGGTEHFLSGPELNSPPGKTERPVTCEVRASAQQRNKEEGEKTLSQRCVFAPFVLQSGGASKDVERYLHIRGWCDVCNTADFHILPRLHRNEDKPQQLARGIAIKKKAPRWRVNAPWFVVLNPGLAVKIIEKVARGPSLSAALIRQKPQQGLFLSYSLGLSLYPLLINCSSRIVIAPFERFTFGFCFTARHQSQKVELPRRVRRQTVPHFVEMPHLLSPENNSIGMSLQEKTCICCVLFTRRR